MLKKTIHIILCLAILASSSGILISKHYCLDELVDVALFGEAKSCQESRTDATVPDTSSPIIQKKSCCKDEISFEKIEDSAENVIADFSIKESFISWAIIQLAIHLPSQSDASFSRTYQHYKPPLLVCDFTVSLQTFLC